MKINFNYIRPSTIARVIEDVAVGTVKGVAHTFKSGKRAFQVEYAARYAYLLALKTIDQNEVIEQMTPAQRRAYDADVKEITDRAVELLAKEAAKREYKATKRAYRKSVPA